jgi:hypothetical protein
MSEPVLRRCRRSSSLAARLNHDPESGVRLSLKIMSECKISDPLAPAPVLILAAASGLGDANWA